MMAFRKIERLNSKNWQMGAINNINGKEYYRTKCQYSGQRHRGGIFSEYETWISLIRLEAASEDQCGRGKEKDHV